MHIPDNERTICPKPMSNGKTRKSVDYIEHFANVGEEIIIMQDFFLEHANMFSWFHDKRIAFFVLYSFLTLGILTTVTVGIFGRKCFEESVLYHLSRSDFRHNFSPQFLHLYILKFIESESYGGVAKFTYFRVAHMYQITLIIFSSIYPFFRKELSPILFIQTIIFVSFNKVVTAQYFLWFGCLLPISLYLLVNFGMINRDHHVNKKLSKSTLNMVAIRTIIFDASLWVFLTCTWLRYAYVLEFDGKNNFKQLWMISIVFHVGQVYLILSSTGLFMIQY